ncbi:hypothetical protein [Rhodopseudomonas parapalustris]
MTSAQTRKIVGAAFTSGLLGISCVALGLLVVTSSCRAQARTPDPAAWRAMSYADLQHPSSSTATYFDIWKEAIDDNNRTYATHGHDRFADGNAPVAEAHFVVWSSRRSVVLSMLNTASGCTTIQTLSKAAVTVRLCPMRLALYEGIEVHVMDAGRGCFVESAAGKTTDQEAAVYASYDVRTRTLRTGAIVNHAVVPDCSFEVPIPTPSDYVR